jgi:4'-phosphopantetheinyl transferase
VIALRWLVLAASDVPSDDDWLSPGEREALARFRLPKRRSDWRLGRWAAKQAVCAVAGEGLSPAEVVVRAASDGAPELFFGERPAPFGLSIAHAGGRALAVVGPRGAVFGADLESVELRSADFIADYFTARERAFVEALPPGERDLAATLVWSAKEAVLKALRTGLREDTRAVEIAPPPAALLRHGGAADWHPLAAKVPSRELSFHGHGRAAGGQVMVVMAAEPAETFEITRRTSRRRREPREPP